MKQDKGLFWFGCQKCQIRGTKNKNASNKNWSVYNRQKCPRCKKVMTFNTK